MKEHSAVAESASNGKAEKAIQPVEDLLRTLKSALQERLGGRIPTSHPVIRWLAEHVATILNRHSVSKGGQTAYSALHGKRSNESMVEFEEKVFFFMPKRLRAKLDLRWKLGIFLGISPNSEEKLIVLANGSAI